MPPGRTPPSPAAPPAVPPSHVLRGWLERERAAAIAKANELGRVLGLPMVRAVKDNRASNGGEG